MPNPVSSKGVPDRTHRITHWNLDLFCVVLSGINEKTLQILGIYRVLMAFEAFLVGTTRFELATPSTPCLYATGLRYVPNFDNFPCGGSKNNGSVSHAKIK